MNFESCSPTLNMKLPFLCNSIYFLDSSLFYFSSFICWSDNFGCLSFYCYYFFLASISFLWATVSIIESCCKNSVFAMFAMYSSLGSCSTANLKFSKEAYFDSFWPTKAPGSSSFFGSAFFSAFLS